jgi:hypothetical protein
MGPAGAHLPDVPVEAMEEIVATMDAVPGTQFSTLFHSVCPYRLLLPPSGVKAVEATMSKFNLLPAGGGSGGAKSSGQKSDKVVTMGAATDGVMFERCAKFSTRMRDCFPCSPIVFLSSAMCCLVNLQTAPWTRNGAISHVVFSLNNSPPPPPPPSPPSCRIAATGPVGAGGGPTRAELRLRSGGGRNGSSTAVIEVPAGGLPLSEGPSQLVPIAEQVDLLTRMLVSHSRGDMCLVGPSGVGKSAVVREFARVLGYSVQPVLLHKDMTSRDLLQVRSQSTSSACLVCVRNLLQMPHVSFFFFVTLGADYLVRPNTKRHLFLTHFLLLQHLLLLGLFFCRREERTRLETPCGCERHS